MIHAADRPSRRRPRHRRRRRHPGHRRAIARPPRVGRPGL